ncbi:MAG: GntR family transcriptional regulator [Kiritimatiellia bacterium]
MKSKFDNIASQLRDEIGKRAYSDRLPSERALAKIFKTTPVTIRRAQQLLIDEGLLVKMQPQGTFVQEKQRILIRVSLLLPLYSKAVLRELQGHFYQAFPDIELEFHPRGENRVKASDCDLIGVASLSPVAYQEVAVPFDNKNFAALSLDGYFTQAFDIHRTGNLYYGLPILFSPLALMGNRRLLESGGFSLDPYALDTPMLISMAGLARKQGMAFWDRDTATRFMRSLVFSAADDSRSLRSVDIKVFRDLFTRIKPLYASGMAAPETTLEKRLMQQGKALLEWSCRQGLLFNRYDPRQAVLYAWPRELRHCTGAAGEFLMLNRQSPHRALAERVALHFLSPGVQAIIGTHAIGLPVLKAAAADSIDTRLWRDDIFLTETKNICANSARDQDFIHRLDALTCELLDANINPETFCSLVEREIDYAGRRHSMRDHFMSRNQAPEDELAETNIG